MKGFLFADSQESRFQASKCWNMCSAVLVVGRSADIHEYIFKLKMFRYGLCQLQGGLFAECEEWLFQAATRSDKSSIILQEGWFPDSQESRFQAAKRSEMCSAFPQGVRIVDAQESRIQFAKRSDMRIAVMKGFDLLIFWNRVLRLGKFTYWLCRPDMWSICWCSGITYSVCESFKNGECSTESF